MSRNQLTPPHAQCNQREIRKPEFMTADLESGVLRFFRHIKCTETFARCHERCENKAKICEKAEFTR
ncbi:MAG: hypothetical protein KDE66_08005, partial [Nitrosomonas sp.]|nr:hypothetical protein [Nitrosomonas sp.]